MRFPQIERFDVLAYDTETTGLDKTARVFGFSISLPDGTDWYWDIREQPDAVQWLNESMAKYEGIVICHNLPFDYIKSADSQMHLPLEQCVDTVVQACLINEHEREYSLDYLAKKYTKSFKKGDELYIELAALFGGRATKNVQVKNFARAPSSLMAVYAKGDSRSTLDLYLWQMKEIAKQGLERIVAFEKRVTPKLIRAAQHGVRVDIPQAEMAVGGLSAEIKLMQKRLDDAAGFACNAQPSKDIAKLFKPQWRDGKWWACDGTPLKPTPAGNFSLGADALRAMSHPAAKIILDLRSLIKTRDTFLVGHVLESAYNGRVYPNVNQSKGEDGGTGTGRLSYSGPALQQIPDRNKKVAEIVKKVFLPDEGHKWVDADMASFEVRIFGHLVGTPDIQAAYERNAETDFHQFVADLTGLPRNASYGGEANAKQLNLSMIFNQGKGTTAEEMGLPWTWETFSPKDGGEDVTYKKAGPEAEKVIRRYHGELPGVAKLAEGCKKTAEQRGYLFTREGRHLRFPRGYQSYKASGILIQSTSADENKRNWNLIDEALYGTESKMLLNTHDSYSMSIPEDDVESTARRVKEMVEQDRGLRVPLILEVQRPGNNWWESKASKRWM